MEIGDEHLDNMIVVAWGNDNLRAAMKHLQPSGIHPIAQRLQRLHTPDYCLLTTVSFIRFPLLHMELFFRQFRILHHLETHIIKALKGADTRGTHRNSSTTVVDQFLDGRTTHTDKLCMHLMALNLLALHGFEGAGSHM